MFVSHGCVEWIQIVTLRANRDAAILVRSKEKKMDVDWSFEKKATDIGIYPKSCRASYRPEIDGGDDRKRRGED